MDATHGIDGDLPGRSFSVVVALFDNIGTFEMIIVAVAALLLFGKRLPEVASQAGATLTKFRRGLDGAIHDSGVEQEIRKIKSAIPTDMSVKDVARAAARKLEDRLREGVEPIEQSVAEAKAALNAPITSEASPRPSPTGESPVPQSPPAPSVPPSPPTAATPAPSVTPGGGASSGTPLAPGIDPASRFVPPGSVPRE
jgi:sec-independent protein translocase protein TatA